MKRDKAKVEPPIPNKNSLNFEEMNLIHHPFLIDASDPSNLTVFTVRPRGLSLTTLRLVSVANAGDGISPHHAMSASPHYRKCYWRSHIHLITPLTILPSVCVLF